VQSRLLCEINFLICLTFFKYQPMSIQYILEIIGTCAFAISGALAVKDKESPDWFTASFTAFVSSIGGGTLRDMLLGSYPLVWISDITILYTILVGILMTFIFYRQLIELRRTLFLFDTFGIALFTIVGTEKAISMGVRPEIAAIMGVFSAVMGGVIRDIMTNDIPIIYQKEVYATACPAWLGRSATWYLIILPWNVPPHLF
jgi:uncharacterized membrane protein YeiH